MSLHLYTTLKTWRLAMHGLKVGTAAERTQTPIAEARMEAANAAVYAAGIACAGQVAEQLNR
jgi:hypothetical protein